jgi:hemerythrin-like domain-containing protein
VEFDKRVNQVLHDEHMAVINLLNRLVAALGQITEASGLDSDNPGTRRLLTELIAAIEGEIDDHFRLEEEKLFPVLDEAGEGDFVAALEEDHEAIRPLARQVAELSRQALDTGLEAGEWFKLRRIGLVFAHDLTAHAEREEMALLPMLEEFLDSEEDIAIWSGHVNGGASAQSAE